MSLERDLPLTYFNPCLREGGDQYGDEYQCNPADFNPRLREGGDNVTRHITIWIQYFNPRLREGGDVTNVPSTK